MVVVGIEVNWHFQLNWLFLFGVYIFIYLNVVLCCTYIVLRCARCANFACLVVFDSFVGVCIQITFFGFHVVCCFNIHGLPFEILQKNHFMLAFIYGIWTLMHVSILIVVLCHISKAVKNIHAHIYFVVVSIVVHTW
jgi:hypothetical protein